ncbi:MAG: glutamine synthetase, partial [Bacteroidaceae bacterium]|nr:glutamine synthetase [Bacteroidaceae bacterium]
MEKNIEMNPNLLVSYLRKPAAEFTRADIVRYCRENKVEFVNFHYCGWDGKLKTLGFVIHSLEHLENILEAGERVDGSSLFPFIEAGKSDLYVIPRYKTAFVNPFSEVPTVDLL